MGSARVIVVVGIAPLASCVALTGAGDLRVDPCFDGCDAASNAAVDGGGGSKLPDDANAPSDAELSGSDAGPPAADRSTLTLSGTGVAVGAVAVATLTLNDKSGARVPHGGAAVAFNDRGGSSVLQIGATTDVGDGTYRSLLTGVTEGTKVSVGATIDGAAIGTALPSIRVVNPVMSGITLSLDAANADGARDFGGSGCVTGGGLTAWSDLSTNAFHGALTAFAQPPCAAASGWNGDGTPGSPYRLTFDGIDDEISFGAVDSLLASQTVLAFVRKSGSGTSGETGTGGITDIFPLVAKGAAEGEMDAIDINFFLGLTKDGHVGTDFEQSNAPASGNNPLLGQTSLRDDAWYMLAVTLDTVASSRVLYVNGTADALAGTTSLPSSGSASRLVIGGADQSTGTADGRFKGDIALVATYARALSGTEIGQIL